MGVLEFVEKVCVQTAVYWEPTGSDGMGGTTYADPVEVSVRWDGHVEVVKDAQGKEVVSRAKIMSPVNLKEQGVLHLGTLADSPTVHSAGAYEILQVKETPLFKSTDKIFRMYYV